MSSNAWNLAMEQIAELALTAARANRELGFGDASEALTTLSIMLKSAEEPPAFRAAVEAEMGEVVEALAWYGEQARLARLIHSEGDAGRHALAMDGGKKARALLSRMEGKP